MPNAHSKYDYYNIRCMKCWSHFEMTATVQIPPNSRHITNEYRRDKRNIYIIWRHPFQLLNLRWFVSSIHEAYFIDIFSVWGGLNGSEWFETHISIATLNKKSSHAELFTDALCYILRVLPMLQPFNFLCVSANRELFNIFHFL